MKKTSKYLIIVTLFSLLFSSCVKDELIEIEEVTTTDLGLFVNEVFSTGDPDWFEIYNSTDAAIDISGFKASDGPVAKYTFPGGTTVPANGYLVIMVVKADLGFSLSSGGEEVYIWDASDNLVDNIAFPALDAGVAFGRATDGGDTFTTMAPSQGAANSNVNSAPYIEASLIEGINDNGVFKYEIVASDASGMRDVKLFIETESNVLFEEMAPLGGGDYQFNIPAMAAGTVAEYYVVATDETGKKTYFPETAPDTKATFTVADGFPVFSNLVINPEIVGADQEATFSVDVLDASGVDEVKIYYTVNSEVADDKEKEVMTHVMGNTYQFVIPGQAGDAVVRYYMRAEDNGGNKTYYLFEEYDVDGNVISDFDHDDATTWPSYTVGAAPMVTTNGFSELAIGGGTATEDLTFNVKVDYSNGAVEEVKFYYIINYDAATYVEDNDRKSFEWAGTLPTSDNMYDFIIPAAELNAGDKVIWYMRAKDGAGDKQYFTKGQDASFDKDIIADWNEVSIIGAAPVVTNGFSELAIVGGTSTEDLTFNVKVEYSNGAVEEVKFYYIINYDAATYVEANDRKSFEWAGDLPTSDNMYNFTVAAAELNAGDKVIWYMRAKDGAGDKQYFTQGKDASFDKDIIADWNEVGVN